MEPRIEALALENAPEASRTILDQVQRAIGMVPNLHRTLAHAPAALRAYFDAVRTLSSGALSPALREQVALATAGLNGCSYCASAHTAIGQGVGLAADEMERNLCSASLDPRSQAVLTFVRTLIENRGAVSDEQVGAIRAAGFTDRELVEIVAHVGLNLFTNTFNVFARTTIDFPEVTLARAS